MGFVPPTLNTKDKAVEEPLLKADDSALVKVMVLLSTVQPEGLPITPVVDDRVQEA